MPTRWKAKELTCVGQERLHCHFDPVVLQETLWGFVLEQGLEDRLSLVAITGVCVPHDTELQHSL